MSTRDSSHGPFALIRVNEQTCFPLASNSKLITSLAIGFMLESGVTLANGQKLALDSRMKDIIPGFEMMDKNGTDTATLLDFLCEWSFGFGTAVDDLGNLLE